MSPITITPEDRALYLVCRIFHTCSDEMILAGWADEADQMLAIARHRLSARQQGIAEERERAAGIADEFADLPNSSSPRRDEARAIAAAIRTNPKGEANE